MDLYALMARRRSVRRYKKEPVPRETLERLVDAATKAPSGCNQQGWVFVVADDPAVKAQIAKLARYGRFIADAGACIAIFCGKETLCLVEDCAAAAQNIMLAAVAEGLGTCWVNSHGLPHSAGVEKLLGCPPTHELAVLLAVGVPEEIPASPHKKPLEEVLRWNRF